MSVTFKNGTIYTTPLFPRGVGKKAKSFTPRSFYNSELQQRPPLLQYRCVNIYDMYTRIYEIVLLTKILLFAISFCNSLNSHHSANIQTLPDEVIELCTLGSIHTRYPTARKRFFINGFFDQFQIDFSLTTIFRVIASFQYFQYIKYLSNTTDWLKNRRKAQYTIHVPIHSIHDAIRH